jgi:hypothetical protein
LAGERMGMALNQLALNQLVSRQGPVPIWAE